MSHSLPVATWIADEAALPVTQRPIPGTSLTSSLMTSEQISALWQRMQQRRQQWMQRSLQERIQRLALVSTRLCRDGAADDAENLARSTGLSLAGMAAAWQVTFAPWTEASIGALVQTLQSQEGHNLTEPLQSRLPQRLVHVLAGNVLPPTWSLLMRGWLLGAAQWLRPSAREPLFASRIMHRVWQIEPLLAEMTTVTWWPHLATGVDPMAYDVLGAADVVTAHGDDESVAAIAASLRQFAAAPRFVGYGARWSCAVLGGRDLTPATAEGIARDVALFDQQGCLSPTRVFVHPDAAIKEWCGWLAQALAEEQLHMPRGEPGDRGRASLRHWLERMRLAQVQGLVRHIWSPTDGTDWSVVLSNACENWQSPLDRHVIVSPVPSGAELRRCLGSQLASVQGVAVRDREAADSWRQEMLQALNPTRLAAAGTLQEAPPSWCQDHQHPLGSLLLDSISDS